MTCFLGQILNPRVTCFFGTEGVYVDLKARDGAITLTVGSLLSLNSHKHRKTCSIYVHPTTTSIISKIPL